MELELKAGWKKDSYAFTNYSYQNARDKETGVALHNVPMGFEQ